MFDEDCLCVLWVSCVDGDIFLYRFEFIEVIKFCFCFNLFENFIDMVVLIDELLEGVEDES